MREKITKASIERLIAGKVDGNAISDDGIDGVRGFLALLLPSGKVTFRYRYMNGGGKRCTVPLGMYPAVTPEAARKEAKRCAGEVLGRADPAAARVEARKQASAEADVDTVNKMLDRHIEHHVSKLGSADEIVRCFAAYVRPQIGELSIYKVGRGDIVRMLDAIAARSIGNVKAFKKKKRTADVQADRVLAFLRKAFNWQMARDENFNSPIVKGMARTKPKQRARDRVLDDQEIRDLYLALDEIAADALVPHCFPAFVRMLLLSATRLRMVSDMTRGEVAERNWTIPGKRNKSGQKHQVVLTDTMLELIDSGSAPHVFSSDNGRTAFKGFSKAKAALDLKLAEIRKRDGRKPMEHWTFHDLRRTARTLMSRIGVDRVVAERVLGHAIAGVEGTYDRHGYDTEKMEALKKLDIEVKRIVRERPTVVPFKRQTA